MAMKQRLMLVLAATATTVGALVLSSPATAVTDSPSRKILEMNQFSELSIKTSIYPKSSHDVFHKDSRKWERGMKRLTRPVIYEPDVYTWELAMAAHRRQLAAMAPPPAPVPLPVAPVEMAPPMMVPPSPGQVQLTPLGPGNRELPANADQRMEMMLSRAQQSGLGPGSPLRAQSIKQRLLDHMNSLTTSPVQDVGNAPAVPILPQNLPRGKGADSYDQSYDRGDE